MSNEKLTSGSGVGFTGLLTLTFIVLKLLNVINWSWWWVLSPLWITALVGGMVILGAYLVFLKNK